MRHGVRAVDGDLIEVEVPAYRNDILHERDLMEDLAIAFGYHRIPPSLLPARTVGKPLPLEDLTGQVRDTLCGLGFHEVMTLVLSNDEDSELVLGLSVDARAVRIENPISGEQTRLRTRLIPGLLQVFRHNLHQPLPQRIFEVGDVTWLDPEAETQAVEQRMISFAQISPKAGFTDARAFAEAIAWEAAVEAPFLAGRCARIRSRQGDPIGILGEIDPEILERLGLENPVVAGELWFEALSGRPPRVRFTLDA
jgi:phenylalanyl-tRNA synthetase beta chain